MARTKSFRLAAAELNVRPSTVSHAITALETRLGVKLLARTTRSVATTEAGGALLARIASAIATLDQAVEAVNAHRERPHGNLRLNVPQNAAATVLAPVLGRFAEAYPDVTVEVTVSDAFVDIVAAGCDAGIRVGESVGGGMSSVRVSDPLAAAVVASPAYWERRPPPLVPADLQSHRCIGRRYGAGRALHRWMFAKGDERTEVAVDGPLVLDAEWMMLSAARDGIGVALLNEQDVAADLAAGRLVRALADWCPPMFAYYLYHPSHRLPSAALRVLIDLLRRDRSTPSGPHPVTCPQHRLACTGLPGRKT